MNWDMNGSLLWERTQILPKGYIPNDVWANATDTYAAGKEVNASSNNYDYNMLKWAPTTNPATTGNTTLNWNDTSGATFYLLFRDTRPITSAYGLTPITNQTTSA
jgi:hypothetical protein